MTGLEFENFNNSEEPLTKEDLDSNLYIDYSIKLIDFLSAKTREHNNHDENKSVTLLQLKAVFSNAAELWNKQFDPKVKIQEWSVARVNMFLAIKAGRKIEYDIKNLSSKHILDASHIVIPIEEDYEQAKKDMETYNLDFDFENIDNLYIKQEKNNTGYHWE